MEDRYLFKAKNKNGKWIYGMPLFYQNGEMSIYEHHQAPKVGYHIVNNGVCDIQTLSQCTGLKDKNGKLIWENDIVKAKYADGFEEITEVAYSKNGYSPYLNEYECEVCCCYCEVTEVEVIGNIFDNQNLLKESRRIDNGKID